MRRENFYTGEVLPDTSPPNLTNEYTTYSEAVQNASFGKYDYDPGSRLMSQPVSIYPGGYGYNPYNNFMNPPVGIGSNPYQYGGYQGYPYYTSNPALAYQQQMQYQQPQEIQYFVSPVNFSGSEYLPPMNFEEEIERLKMEYWAREQEQSAQDFVDRQNSGYYSPFGGYTNYYGVPYYNPYQYNSLNSEISQKITEMQNEARENRINLNMHLARLAHNYIGDDYDDEQLQERYTGKQVTAPGGGFVTPAEIYTFNRFQNMVPFDNSQFYRDHDMAASRAYHSIISKDSNMQECFENMGVINAQYEMEEEQHRRRNGAVLYNSDDNSYKYFVRTKAAERYAQKKGTVINGNNNMAQNNALQQYQQGLINQFPTLSQSAKLCDDGTLNITCNFGSKAGQTYSVHNSQEAGYEENRSRFQSFIDSIPGSIYLNNPNPNAGGGLDGK